MQVNCMKLFLTLLTMIFGIALAQSTQPIIKEGSCPSGYITSGNYCVPTGDNSHFAISKNGSCPSGYITSGNYCLSSSDNSKVAIEKQGSCPSGYITSGNYCLSNR